MSDIRIVTPITGRKTVAATGTPEALVPAPQSVQSVELVAQKTQGVANTGTVYLGWSAADGSQDRPLAPGAVFEIAAGPGQKLDLAALYLDVVTSGDGVTFIAMP